MAKVEVVVETTRSRRGGRHISVARAVIVGGAAPRVLGPGDASRPMRGTYSRGAAGLVSVDLSPGELLVHVTLRRGPSGRVTGEAVVYEHDGRQVLRAVIRKLKVRRSSGDPSYGWAVEEALKALGIDRYIKKYNWSTGARA